MKKIFLTTVFLFGLVAHASAYDFRQRTHRQIIRRRTSTYSRGTSLGNLSANRYNPNSTSNPYGAGSKYRANSVNNTYGQYGSPFSNKSVSNPYATNAPKLYDSNGNYRGNLNTNKYDPNSVSNPNGRYGSKYSPDSINNPNGAGSPYKPDSPNNPYGTGMKIQGQ